MWYRHSLRDGLLALSLGLILLPVRAGDDCEVAASHWQTREAVRQMAAARGWQILRLKIDDGCYELRATDAQGRSFKARIDPETLKVLKLKPDERTQRARDRARDREHNRDRDRHDGASRPPPGASAPPTPSPAAARGHGD